MLYYLMKHQARQVHSIPHPIHCVTLCPQEIPNNPINLSTNKFRYPKELHWINSGKNQNKYSESSIKE